MIKNLVLGVILGASFAAAADTLSPEAIANMVAQSEAVMSAGLCAVANDTTNYGSQTVLVVLPPPVGARRIPLNTYNQMRNLGYSKAPTGLFAMSQWIPDHCAVDALSDGCLAARSFWSQAPLLAHPPGSGVFVH